MGADIYLQSVAKKAHRENEPKFREAVKRRDDALYLGDDKAASMAQKDVEKYHDAMYPKEGYFRDSYNNTSLFSILGLSWWGLEGIDHDGHLPIDQAKLLRDELQAKEVERAKVVERFGEREKSPDRSSTDEWHQFFEDKRTHLIALLDKSIELNEPLYCSV